MRKIETEMLSAALQGRNWKSANTRVDAHEAVIGGVLNTWTEVYLHGNHIATVHSDGQVEPDIYTVEQWPTRTTLSRLRALGVDVRMKAGQLYFDGEQA